MNKSKKVLLLIIGIILSLLILLFLIRLFSDRHLDDLSPEIPCDEELIKKSDVLFVIPKFNNNSISNNLSWCKSILNYNKPLALHGIYHEYNEFLTDRDSDYLLEGELAFQECFNQTPTMFKPPQLEISSNNLKLLEELNYKVYHEKNNFFHKSFHCDDTGFLPNWFHDLF